MNVHQSNYLACVKEKLNASNVSCIPIIAGVSRRLLVWESSLKADQIKCKLNVVFYGPQ